ncbi:MULTISPECIES: DNA packaging protein [Stappia]|nr:MULTISPECIES: DNA packaging protein [Stappia]MCA1298497.1 DNA packaging protein [Stappia indica]GGE96133.1 hypothetical protein GCM10007285_24720 [Stappia taiwanensis]
MSDMIGEPRTLRKSDFAKVANVSPGRVSQMIRAGLPVEPDGRIDVARGRLWIQSNIDPKRSAAQSDQGDLPLAARTDAATERARLVKEQADHAALKNALLRQDLLPAADVEREWTDMLRRVRSRLLAVPSRLRQVLPHLTAHDVGAIDTELRHALEDLANAE